MALVVNTNLASLVAQQNSWQSRSAMEKSMERLSSGLRVNGAADDAAGLAIATRMDTQIRGLTKGIQNANDAISLVQTAEGAQVEITEMLQRIRELAVQASNSTNNDNDRAALDAEVQALVAEIDQIGEKTQFNGQAILDGGFRVQAQMGPQADYDLSFFVDSMRTDNLGLGGSTGGGLNNVYIGDRVALANVAAVLDGDIEINGQKLDLSDIVAADDITDIAAQINETIEGVTASSYNEVVMQRIGTGVISDAANVTIAVDLTNNQEGVAPGSVTFTLDESGSLQEMVDNINRQANGVVYATINSDGRMVLSNNTGGSITVTDTTDATGIDTESGTEYEGFLKLVGDEGQAVNVQRGWTSTSADADLTVLGMMATGRDNDASSANQILGNALTDTTTEWGKGDIHINGVDVYDSTIDTDSFAGKLQAMNAVSDQTGVIASAYFQEFYDVTDAIANGTTAGSTVTINGVDIALAATVTTLVTNINAAAEDTGIRAESFGNTIKLYGNVSAAVISYTSTVTGDEPFGTAGTTFAGILLDSLNDTAISIDLGESAAVAEHGFVEVNVGAADFDTSSPRTLSSSGGASLSGVSVASESAATSAISVIDGALEHVSASRANLGAINNRISHAITSMQETIVNTSTAKSRIMDADFAVESANLAKQQVLQQASTAMLAQANAATQTVLTLLS
jgi:flagellin